MKTIRNRPLYQRLFLSLQTRLIVGGFLLLALGVSVGNTFFMARPAAALQTVPYKMNFQGNLTTPAGAAVADGLYNMKFRLYSTTSGGTAVWSELRETSSRVSLTGGYFSVQLGDVTPLSPGLFTTQPLYLEVELPSTATATCSTSGCASYTEGPMTPRQPLGASPYAMNSDTLDGLDSTSFGRLDLGNTFTGANVFKNTSDSTTAFQIQTAGAASLFVADTANARIQIGSATADGTAIALVLDTKNTGGDPAGTNGAMYYNSSLGKFRCYENGAWVNCITNGQTIVTLASDVVNNNATADTMADVTGLSFPVTAGQTYHFSALVNYTAAATTTGSRWAINGPASSMLSYMSTYTLSATAQTQNFAAAYDMPAASNASSQTVGNIAKVEGMVTPTGNGVMTVRFASEIGGSAITAKAGSTLTWW